MTDPHDTDHDYQRQYKESVQERAGEPVVDIPDTRVLEHQSPAELIAEFQTTWGMKPAAVCLPICSPDGVNFKETSCGLPISRVAESGQVDFAAAVAEFANHGCDIYLSIDPTFSFLNVDQLQVVDSRGSTSVQLCFGKSGTQELVGMTLADGLNLAVSAIGPDRVRGTVCDLVNLWPMGAHNGRLDLTCFCNDCLNALTEAGAGDVASEFLTHPNPWNLLLAENEQGDGISFINDFTSTASPAILVGLSKVRGFIDIFGEVGAATHGQLAERLMEYLKARHKQTVRSLQSCRDTLSKYAPEKSDGFDWVIITEGEKYSWSAGIFLDLLDSWEQWMSAQPVTEVWFNPASNSPVMSSLPYRSYMWDRSRYMIDGFFQFATSVSDSFRRATTGLGRVPEGRAKQMLESRLRVALGGETASLAGLVALSDQSDSDSGGRVGFIGVGLSKQVGKQIIETIDVAPDLTR